MLITKLPYNTLNGRVPTHGIVVIWVNIFQTEFMVEMYYKSLVRAFGNVLLMKSSLARTPINTRKGDEKWPLFVNKQLFWWSHQ